MKNAFDGIISRLNIAELTISVPKYTPMEILKLKIKEEKNQNRIPKTCGIVIKGTIYV